MNRESAASALLDTADELFYRQGVHAVGMDEIRAKSGVSLKRLYQLYPSKEQLVIAWLARRDTRWRAELADYVEQHGASAEQRILAVFDWLRAWFAQPGFRGCAWINSFAELGVSSPAVAEQARQHKGAFRAYLHQLAHAAGRTGEFADALLLIAEGAITTAAISGQPETARQARATAAQLLDRPPPTLH